MHQFVDDISTQRAEDLVLTFGIDLASQPKKTAGCLVAWTDRDASVADLKIGLTDADILTLAEGADIVAIDAPFGWPQPFKDFVTGSAPSREASVWNAESRDQLCFRRTDLYVRRVLGRPPLSVSSDKIAIPAMRCAGLLDRLGVMDRSGIGRVVEVYPAVALQVWNFASRNYKGGTRTVSHQSENLAILVQSLVAACPWLRLSDEITRLCSHNDDAFDAMIAAFVGRASALDLTISPPEEELALAMTEGWIAVPRPGTLSQLVGNQMS